MSDSRALASIDRQAPTLTYLGLGCWIAWNTIAFSGSFWLHETDNSSIAENLMLVHLLACFVTLAAVALFSDRCSRWIAKNRTTLIGGVVACAGIAAYNARAEVRRRIPHAGLTVLFTSGCILSGAGTTMLFLRAAALFGTLCAASRPVSPGRVYAVLHCGVLRAERLPATDCCGGIRCAAVAGRGAVLASVSATCAAKSRCFPRPCS